MLTRKTNISKSPLETIKQREHFKHLFSSCKQFMPLQGSCSPYANIALSKMSQYRQEDAELMNRHKRQIAEYNGHAYEEQSPTKGDYFRSQNRIAKLMGNNKAAAAAQQSGQKPQQEDKSQCSSATTAISIVNYSNNKNENKKTEKKTSSRSSKTKNSASTVKLLGKRKREQSEILKNRIEETKQNSYQTQIERLTGDKLSPCSMDQVGDLTQNETSMERSVLHSQNDMVYIKTEDASALQNTKVKELKVAQISKSKCSKAETTSSTTTPTLKKFKIMNLKDKHNNIKQRFKIYNEKDLSFLRARRGDGKGKLVLDFNMNKLELEYDYDTDCDQLMTAKEMLVQETISAVEFCVKEDPLLLVGNFNEY